MDFTIPHSGVIPNGTPEGPLCGGLKRGPSRPGVPGIRDDTAWWTGSGTRSDVRPTHFPLPCHPRIVPRRVIFPFGRNEAPHAHRQVIPWAIHPREETPSQFGDEPKMVPDTVHYMGRMLTGDEG